MLCILLYSCFLFFFFVFLFLFVFLFVFIQNVLVLTISPIKKELDLHVDSDGGLKEDCKVTCCCCCCCYCSHVQVNS